MDNPVDRVVLGVIAFLIPLLGFVVGIVFLCKKKVADQQTGLYILLTSIVSFVFWMAVLSN